MKKNFRYILIKRKRKEKLILKLWKNDFTSWVFCGTNTQIKERFSKIINAMKGPNLRKMNLKISHRYHHCYDCPSYPDREIERTGAALSKRDKWLRLAKGLITLTRRV
jgi:hypothetical protein